MAIVPFLIDATQIAFDTAAGNAQDGGAELDCTQLLGAPGSTPTGLLPASAYWQLAQIPTGTFLDGNTYLLAITGCPAGYTPPDPLAEAGVATGLTAAGTCGAGYTGTAPNVAIQVVHLDTTTSADGGFGVQFVNLSSALDGDPFVFNDSPLAEHPAASGGLVPGFVAPVSTGEDGGTVDTWIPLDPALTPISYLNATAPATVVNIDPTTPNLQFGVLTAPGSLADGGFSFLPFPGQNAGGTVTLGDVLAFPLLSQANSVPIDTVSDWAATVAEGGAPATYATGTTFTFLIVGDDNYSLVPDGTSTAAFGRFVHILAFPNVFTPPRYAP